MADELLAPPNPHNPLIGREAELKWLAEESYRRERRYPDKPLVVLGEAGIGKTALVATFVKQLSKSERAIWIQCRNFDKNEAAFQVAMRRGLAGEREVVAVLDGADEVSEEEFKQTFRGVVNFKAIRSVIITSRRDLHLREERALRIEGLKEGDAKSLIEGGLATLSIADASMQQILGIVKGHPLAISLINKMARSMDKEQLRRVLEGHLYDLNDTNIVQQNQLIEIAKPIVVSANEAMIAELKKHPDDIFRLTSRQYEELIAELIRDMGYEVTLTKTTRDGGKDILASIKTEMGDFLCLVEAKHYREDRKVGVSLVRELYGTLCDYQANSAMLVTTSSYSPDAKALQQKHQYQLSLRDYTDVATWIQRYGRQKSN
jgi:HJR/Mrr/RecB family endonuclease